VRTRHRALAFGACVSATVLLASVPGFQTHAQEEPRSATEAGSAELQVSRNAPLRIDLATALRLADQRNLDVAIYVQRVAEASARLSEARTLAVPTVSVGGDYNRHHGPLQETGGQILDVDRVSQMLGLGAGAIGAGDPRLPGLTLDVDVADAIFQPLVARQNQAAVEAAAAANQHAVLLDVAAAYLEWLAARADASVAAEAQQRAEDLAAVTATYAQSGEGLQADADMAAVQPLLSRQRLFAAQAETEASVATLTRLLHLDSGVQLEPMETDIPILNIVSENADVRRLIQDALVNRPETDQADALLAAADHDLRAARYGLFIPSVALGYSTGQFGGGPGASIEDTARRDDLTVLLYWQFDHFGLANRARIDGKEATLRRLGLERDKLHDAIAAEVEADYARVQSLRQQIRLTSDAVTRASSAYRLNRTRIYDRQGLPIEALQAMQSFAEAERANVQVMMQYSVAQMRLYTALGNPLDSPQLNLPAAR
jgi:outer membrane protein TolC